MCNPGQKLQALNLSTRSGGTSKSRMSVLRQELGFLEAWVGELQLEHLGPDFTQRLAEQCGLWSSSYDWTEAQFCIDTFQKTSATHSTEALPNAFGCVSSEGAQQSFRVGLHQSKARVQESSLKRIPMHYFALEHLRI